MPRPKLEPPCVGTRGGLLAFFEFPDEHWLHLRTASVIESPVATARLRRRVT